MASQCSVTVLIIRHGCGKGILRSCQQLEAKQKRRCVFSHFIVNAVVEILGAATGAAVSRVDGLGTTTAASMILVAYELFTGEGIADGVQEVAMMRVER